MKFSNKLPFSGINVANYTIKMLIINFKIMVARKAFIFWDTQKFLRHVENIMIFRHFKDIQKHLALRFPRFFLETILSSVPETIQFRISHSKNVFQIIKQQFSKMTDCSDIESAYQCTSSNSFYCKKSLVILAEVIHSKSIYFAM